MNVRQTWACTFLLRVALSLLVTSCACLCHSDIFVVHCFSLSYRLFADKHSSAIFGPSQFTSVILLIVVPVMLSDFVVEHNVRKTYLRVRIWHVDMHLLIENRQNIRDIYQNKLHTCTATRGSLRLGQIIDFYLYDDWHNIRSPVSISLVLVYITLTSMITWSWLACFTHAACFA